MLIRRIRIAGNGAPIGNSYVFKQLFSYLLKAIFAQTDLLPGASHLSSIRTILSFKSTPILEEFWQHHSP